MEALRKIGCSFSLDDFGTGYSSLSQLNQLPISEIKIDRSFILGALNDAVSANIVEMVYRVGEAMGVRVVAEGVETDKHVKFLASSYPNVHLQGYAFGRPQALSSLLGG
jgi:EAL domain-containing protein (putative c-di-GMP-specific phosphodiesterase class I)